MGRRSRLVAAATISVTPVIAGLMWAPDTVAWFATGVSMAWILAAAGLDMLWHRLPDALLGLAFLPIAMAAAGLTIRGSETALSATSYSAAAWTIPVLAVHGIAPAHVGFGDVKLAAAIGATVGLTAPPLVAAVGLVVALTLPLFAGLAGRRSEIALGPFLAAGAPVAIGLGGVVVAWS